MDALGVVEFDGEQQRHDLDAKGSPVDEVPQEEELPLRRTAED
jgi:hypothetical protein